MAPKETAIELTLAADFDEASFGLPVVYPNIDVIPNPPYIRFEIVRVNRRDDTLAGEQTISRGQVIATAVTTKGRKSKNGNEIADAIAERYPMGRRIPVTGGEIVIIKPADIKEGFPQDADWRTPVIIDYEAS